MRPTEKLPPGPAEHPVLQGLRFGRDPFGFLDECSRRFGSAFTMRFPRDPPRVVVSDPAHVRQVFALKPDAYSASAVQIPVNLGARSLLFLDGEEHRRDRQLMMPSLHGDRLKSYAHTMYDVTMSHVRRLPRGERVDMKRVLHEITFDVLTACLVGGSTPARVEQIRSSLAAWIHVVFTPETFLLGLAMGPRRLRATLDRATARGGSTGWRWLDRAPWNVAGRAKHDAMSILREEVVACRSGGSSGRSDVLATIANARYEDGAPIAVDHAVDELVTLLVGGHETTANSLAWVLCHVLPRPDLLDQLEQERARVFPGGEIDPARASELALLEACILETMRRTPIAPAVNRNLLKPLSLDPWLIPAGGIVFPSTYVTHHRQDLWDRPRDFVPQRFLDKEGVPPDRFYPFGGGRRTCIGNAFAIFEMRIVLLALLGELSLVRTTTSLEAEFRALTSVPKSCDVIASNKARAA
ncbi:MAG: cytochrome P450 [Polyangiaceae bacterium]|nr:cytochrome P450 [Polyangiaceae bacterium]